jgi:hypothetical protein
MLYKTLGVAIKSRMKRGVANTSETDGVGSRGTNHSKMLSTT